MLISLDTVRRDAVGAYSSDWPSPTPTLDAFAREAVVLDTVWAPVPFTLPSHMTMFTSVGPGVHRVTKKTARLAASIPTLPEQLQAAGYHGHGLVSNIWMKGEFGFARGFDHYRRVDYDLDYAGRIVQQALNLLDGLPEKQPTFLFLHFLDAHSDFADVTHNSLPYYVSSTVLEQLGLDSNDPRFCNSDGKCATDFLIAEDTARRPVDRDLIALIHTLYRGGVSDLDRALAKLFDGLRQRRLWDGALIVITSDHGEEFREHGSFIHVQPYVENLAVPMMVRLPHGQMGGTRRTGTFELADLMPTLLDLLELPLPTDIQGRSLKGVLTGDAGSDEARVVLGHDKLRSQRFSLRTRDLTLIHDFGTDTSELYWRAIDPGEKVDLAARRPVEVAALLATMRERIDADRRLRATLLRGETTGPDATGEVLSPEEAAKLKAIGYVE